MPKIITPLERAIAIAGSQSALASAMSTPSRKVSQSHIWNWLNREPCEVPAEYCPSIERVTAGQVTCEQLAPKVEWEVLRLMVAEE